MKDEKRVCDIIDKVQLYLEYQNIESEVCRIYMRKIDHLYYKFDPLVLKQKKVRLFHYLFVILVCKKFNKFIAIY